MFNYHSVCILRVLRLTIFYPFLYHVIIVIVNIAGVQQENYDDSHPSITTSSTSSLACDTKSLEEGILMTTGGIIMSESQAITGASDLITLLAILGEGYRLLCMYSCQVLHSDS